MSTTSLTDELYDYMGTRIEPGDVVVYPVRKRSDMRLATMTITMFTGEHIRGYNTEGRQIGNFLRRNSNRMVVVSKKSDLAF